MIPSTFYYEMLFDDDDHVCYGVNKYANEVVHHDDPIRNDSEFLTLNAHKPGSTRADANVVKYRNLLVEIDDISLDEQKAFVKRVALPWSTAVYSGGKSIHFVISLFHPLPDEESYRALWCGIQQVFESVGCTIDSKCKNPSRFTRAPNGYRREKKRDQLLLKVKERVPNHELFAWLRRNGVDGIDQFRPKRMEQVALRTTADDDERFEHAVRMMGSDSYGSGNKNSYQYKLAIRCKQVGFSESEAERLIENHCGALDKRGPVASAYRKNVEHVNVLSKEDYKAMKALEKLNKLN